MRFIFSEFCSCHNVVSDESSRFSLREWRNKTDFYVYFQLYSSKSSFYAVFYCCRNWKISTKLQWFNGWMNPSEEPPQTTMCTKLSTFGLNISENCICTTWLFYTIKLTKFLFRLFSFCGWTYFTNLLYLLRIEITIGQILLSIKLYVYKCTEFPQNLNEKFKKRNK